MRRGLRHWARFGRPASPELGTAVPLWGAGARKLAVPSVALIQRFHSSRRAFCVRLCCPLIRSPPISPNAYPTRCCSLNITRYHRSRSFSLVGIFSVCTAPKTRNGVKPAVFVTVAGTTFTLIIPRRHDLDTACCRPTTTQFRQLHSQSQQILRPCSILFLAGFIRIFNVAIALSYLASNPGNDQGPAPGRPDCP